MASRKTRAAAKAEEDTSPSTDTQHNPLDPEDQALEQERDDDSEQANESSEDMARPKSRKGGKNGAKKKASKKAKTTLTPEATPEAETVEETPALVAEEVEFNPAAMPILRSPKKDAEAESSGKLPTPCDLHPLLKTTELGPRSIDFCQYLAPETLGTYHSPY